MSEKNWQFELEEYIKQGEPEKTEKSDAWRTAIGLQAVDGLKTSDYLLDTAKEHIEGNITIDEAQKRIQSYYEQRTERTEIEDATMPYDYDLTNRLICAAKRSGCDFAVDLFYRYGTDASQAVKGGNNVRGAAFGMGVYSSHGVERAHVDGIENTARLMIAYVLDI